MVSTILQDDESKGKGSDTASHLGNADAPLPYAEGKKCLRAALPKRQPNTENITVQDAGQEEAGSGRLRGKQPLSGESDRLNRERKSEKGDWKAANEKLQQAYKERVLEAKKYETASRNTS